MLSGRLFGNIQFKVLKVDMEFLKCSNAFMSQTEVLQVAHLIGLLLYGCYESCDPENGLFYYINYS